LSTPFAERSVFVKLSIMNAASYLFLFFLPALIVLGHDGYLYFFENPDQFELSALGYLWTQYSAETYASVSQGMDPEQWRWVEILLKQRAVYVLAALGIVLSSVYGAIRVLGLIGFGMERLSFEMRKK
jgi:hypothetical protein